MPDEPRIPGNIDLGTDEIKVNYGKIDYTRAQGIRFYANHVGGSVTLFDIRLLFSDVDMAGDGVSAVQTMTVLMSPELAALAYSVLGKALDNYTKGYGKTRLPASSLKAPTEPPPGA